MSGDVASMVAEGNEALVAGDWQAARSLFERSLEIDETPEAFFGLGEAVWWLGDLNTSIEHREHAYRLFRRRPDPAAAFLSALYLIFDYQSHIGNYAVAAGWLARAQRLADDFGLEEFEGWLNLARSNQESDPARAETLARRALEVASASSDLDLELCALSQVGFCLVEQGRVREGVAYLDEAMAGSLGGEGESRDTVVFASCNMMISCIGAADFDRAIRWVHAADRFVQRYGCPFLYAKCRTTYGRVLFATGDWTAAERELKTAVGSSHGSVPVFHGQAVAQLAELRLAQGRPTEARWLISGIEDQGWAVPVVARLHMSAGRHAAAEALVRRHLRHLRHAQLESGVLLELLGETEIAQGRAETAAEIGRGLLETGEELDCRVLAVRGDRLLGRAAMATRDAVAARRHLERALVGFNDLQMVYEAAGTRLLLGERLAETDPQIAEMEARASYHIFTGFLLARMSHTPDGRSTTHGGGGSWRGTGQSGWRPRMSSRRSWRGSVTTST